VNTAVDSSVLLAIVKGEASAEAWMNRLISARENGGLLACEAMWAETRQIYSSREAHAKAMEAFGLQFSPLLPATAALAGEIHQAYRRAGGQRERILADFLIGAHALIQADQLATADDGYLRPHFRQLKVLKL